MKKNQRSNKQDLLKIIGILTMLVDHLGWVFFPQYIFLHAVGRLAMPIFSAGIAFGYQKTANFRKYFFYLVVFGLISQIPYDLLWTFEQINIIFGLALSLFLLYLVDNKKYLLAIGIFTLSIVLPFEFGWYLPLTTLIFFKFGHDKKLAFSLLTLITFVYSSQIRVPYQIFSLVGFYLILFMPEIKRSFRLNKFIFYFFYPVHLFILYFISKWLLV